MNRRTIVQPGCSSHPWDSPHRGWRDKSFQKIYCQLAPRIQIVRTIARLCRQRAFSTIHKPLTYNCTGVCLSNSDADCTTTAAVNCQQKRLVQGLQVFSYSLSGTFPETIVITYENPPFYQTGKQVQQLVLS